MADLGPPPGRTTSKSAGDATGTAGENRVTGAEEWEMDRKAHWQKVYETKAPDAVSWFQERPTVSARLLEAAGISPAT